MPFKVNITLDIDRFEAAITDINKRVRHETGAASLDAAQYLADEVKVLLSIWPHPPGTPSPTKPFKGPPGLISGHLMESVEVREQPIGGFTKVGVGAVYSRIQELGGFAGLGHRTYIPPRPYLRPTVTDMRTEIVIGSIYYEHWRKAMLAAVPAGLLK